jgi:hypothetical protein
MALDRQSFGVLGALAASRFEGGARLAFGEVMGRWLSGVVVAMVAVSGVGPAHAGTPRWSIDPSTLREQLPARAQAIGVLVVGTGGSAEAAARDAVVAALTTPGRSVRIIGGLGGARVEEPTPEAIVGLCSFLNLDVVAVVRLLTLSDGPLLQVELRDRSGVVARANTAPREGETRATTSTGARGAVLTVRQE